MNSNNSAAGGSVASGSRTALALMPEAQTQGIQVSQMGMSLGETLELGKVLASSGFFADAREAAQAVTKVLAGRELGIAPVASLTGIYIVKGRVTLGANLIAAQIKRSSRYDYRVKELTDQACEVVFFEGGQECGTSRFTSEDARRAGLDSNDTYKKFPRNMLYARAMSNGARWFAPDVFSGPVYTPDELGADVETNETGDVIRVRDVTPVVAATASGEGVNAQTGEILDPRELAAAKKNCAGQVKRLRLKDAENSWLVEELRSLVVPEWDGQSGMSVLQYKRLNDRLCRFKSAADAADWVGLQKDEARKATEVARAQGEPTLKVFEEKEMTWVSATEANQVAKPKDAIFNEGESGAEPDDVPF